jgi:integrase
MMGHRGHGEGSIFQRKSDGRWVAAVTVTDASGRTRRVRHYAKTRAEARATLRELQRRQEAGVHLTARSFTLAAYLDQWLSASVKPSVRPRTYEGYESIVRVRVVPRIGGLKLPQVTPAIVQQLYTELSTAGLSSRSVIHTHACLHKAFSQALRWGLIARNPCDAVDPPRAEHAEMRTLSSEQMTRFLEATKEDRLHALYVVAASAGLRLGELLGLQWHDLDLDASRLQVRRSLQRHRNAGLVFSEPKTSRSRRTVLLSQRAVVALREHRKRQLAERLALGPMWQDHDLVFCNLMGGPLDPGTVSSGFGVALKRAGLPTVRFHDLRHTCATLLLQAGTHPKVVSEMLGHTTIVLTLDTYSHVVPAMHAEAAATMDALLGT